MHTVEMAELVELFQRLGITANYEGYWYLLRAIQAIPMDGSVMFRIAKDLYPAIAKEYQTTRLNVEHNIRTAIDRCWEKGNRELLCEICYFTKRPTNLEFITMIASYLYRKSQNLR